MTYGISAVRRLSRARAKAAAMGESGLRHWYFPLFQRDAEDAGDGVDVFVAATGEVDDEELVGAEVTALSEGEDGGDGVRRFERRE